jgi:NADH-quinone oxidoreductase subunit J
MMLWLGFSLISLVILNGALNVVKSDDLVHTVFWLALTLLGTAALFVHLDAEFLAAVQVLLYTGGVVTLMLFGVMLTRRVSDVRIVHGTANKVRAIASALAVFGAIVLAVVRDKQTAHAVATDLADTEALGIMVFQDMVLPFELLSLLLLAAMVGAIALARKVDPS